MTRDDIDLKPLPFTGVPYILYKDACNAKSNQQHLGCLKTSNLCSEILEYTSVDEVAVRAGVLRAPPSSFAHFPLSIVVRSA